jgi:hypothetical protein
MIKRIEITLTIAVLAALCCIPVKGYSAVIATDGVAKAVIVIGRDANEPECHAADELAAFLGQVTGAKFEIANAAVATKTNLFVGPAAAKLADANFTTDGLGTDGIVIRTAGNNLILAGGKPRGTLYAVYTFLEDYVGCRWWTDKVSFLPKKPDLSFGKLDRRYVPVMEHREILITPITLDPDWSVRNKCVGELHGYGHFEIMAERGGTRKAWPCGHSYFTVLPPEKYFAQHPEWYSLIDGKRVGTPRGLTSLCLTNQEMVKVFIGRTEEEVARVKELYPTGTDYVSVSAEDESSPCQCDLCMAGDKEEGSPAGLALRLANSVADAFVRDGVDKAVTMFAYHHTLKPPRHEKPRPNVIIYFCPIHAASNSLPMTNPRFKTWNEDLQGWLKISKRVYVYDYPDNVSYELVPHPNLRALSTNIKEWAKAGVRGYYGDGQASCTGGTEMAELRTWLIAKLIWDPSQDPNKLIREFTDGYYGPAGKEIVAYLDVMHNAVEVSSDLLDLSSPPDAYFLSIQTLVDGWAHLRTAENAVKDDPVLLPRVKIAQMPVMFVFLVRWDQLKWGATCNGIEWPLSASRDEVYKQFMDIVKTSGVTLSPQSQKLLVKGGNSTYLPPKVD